MSIEQPPITVHWGLQTVSLTARGGGVWGNGHLRLLRVHRGYRMLYTAPTQAFEEFESEGRTPQHAADELRALFQQHAEIIASLAIGSEVPFCPP